MKILFVHGVGKHDQEDPRWQDRWVDAARDAVDDPRATVEFFFHDHEFDQAGLTFWEMSKALTTLSGNWLFGRTRGLSDVYESVRWTAGMVMQWAGKPELRARLRTLLKSKITEFDPDIIIGHSLGSLISYDLFTTDPDTIRDRAFVSVGSQINHPALSSYFHGGVRPLMDKAVWLHIYNPSDPVFTYPIPQDVEDADNCLQITVPFGSSWVESHTNLQRYLNNEESEDARRAWQFVREFINREEVEAVAAPTLPSRQLAMTQRASRRPNRKALLIGINEYEHSRLSPLAGCVNDVYLVSAALQERGFEPEEIRVVLNDRATTAGIHERLDWLFHDCAPDDTRLLYYSGHGVRLPAYNAEVEPDRLVEALVPFDFDFSLERAITDRNLSSYYAQLPRGTNVVLAFDCCHAGGLSNSGRSGRTSSRRGVDLPDDVRHRMLRWNAREQMWVPRDFQSLLPGSTGKSPSSWRKAYTGESGSVERIGRDVARRAISSEEFDYLKRTTGWAGGFLPVIIEACREDQLADEYAHGDISFGAFTYAWSQVLREQKRLTFRELVEETRKKLERLGYVQVPSLTGPAALLDAEIP